MLEIVVAAGVAAAAAAGMRVAAKWRRQHSEAWTAAAASVGGRFVPRAGSWWKPTAAHVLATFARGVEVAVDHYTVSTGKSSTTYTRVQAVAPGADELEIKLRKEGVVASMGKALGFGELVVGDAAFDARYFVRTNDDELARAWLQAGVRAALMATGSEYEVVLHKGRVKAQRVGIELVPARLEAAMRAVAALAAGGRGLVASWRALAAELGGRYVGPDDAFVPGRVRIDGESAGHVVAVVTDADAASGTRVRRELGRKDAPRFELGAGGALADVAALGAGAGAGEAWQAVQPARLECDGEGIVVTWPGYVADAARVRAAFRLLGAVLTGAPVPYR